MSIHIGDNCWFMATNGVDVFHYHMVSVGCQMESGQPYVLKAMTEVELFDKVFVDPTPSEDGTYSSEGQTVRTLVEIQSNAI